MPEFEQATARLASAEPEAGLLRLSLHGEYQLRAALLSELELRRADGSTDTLGQTQRVYHWLRVTPELQVGRRVTVVGQVDVPEGLLLGQRTRDVEAAERSLSERQPMQVDPRWLFVEYRPNFGRLRAGQMPSHFGLGVLTNDGDHPALFGDYFAGDRVERLELVARPFGASSSLEALAAADVVYRDDRADLTDGDLAAQGTAAFYYRTSAPSLLGVYVRYRHERQPARSLSISRADLTADTATIDSSGRFTVALPGDGGYAFGAYEAIVELGRSALDGSLAQIRRGERIDVLRFGAVARIGTAFVSGTGADRYGKAVLSLEWGFASGDANLYDDVAREFRFHTDYNVGLVLFDEVMAWKTARAASIGAAQGLPERDAERRATNGAVSGATYLNPTFVYRPVRELDLKAGVILAHATSDVVDPTFVDLQARSVNFDGGDPTARDLGLELDAGVELRVPLEHGLGFEVGAQAGVLFPGAAFDDRHGRGLPAQWLALLRAGLQY